MNDRWSKIAAVLSLLTLLSVGFVIYRSYSPYSLTGTDFSPSGDTVTTDLLGKSVTLPQGQLWGFNPDQTLKVRVVNRRQIDTDGVVLTVEVTAEVRFPAPPKEGPGALKPGDPPPPKRANLSGLAKVFYERHEGTWYLTNIEGINLKVAASAE